MSQQQHKQNNNSPNEQVEQILKFLSESPEAASSVHDYLQKNYFSKYQFKKPNSSTPKRSHPLDESGGSINNGNNRRQHQRKRFQRSQENETELNDLQSTTQSNRQGVNSLTSTQQVTTENINNRKHISFAQLKHAVSSSLPCFYVQWPLETDRKKIPSAICTSELISKELKTNGVEFNGFILVGWAGKKLKLGVNNKVDYATLVAIDK
ncbi:unnamed protein product [Rotaria sp. Silwood1]|nr:unnamed protein product [Rotaria sp. Silwood1]